MENIHTFRKRTFFKFASVFSAGKILHNEAQVFIDWCLNLIIRDNKKNYKSVVLNRIEMIKNLVKL